MFIHIQIYIYKFVLSTNQARALKQNDKKRYFIDKMFQEFVDFL